MEHTPDLAAVEALRSFQVASPEEPLLGRYRVERLLSRGTAYSTFVALDEAQQETVVLRVAATSMSPAAQARIVHESGLILQLRNPGLAPLREFRREEQYFLWVRPFLPGESLLSLAQRQLTLPTTLDIFRSLFSALRELHSRGLLCRSLRPTNLIVPEMPNNSGLVLTDFGAAGRGLLDADARRQTVDDAIYLSPEQAGSLDYDVGPPADLYSAGVVLFEFLAGRPPFQGETVGAVLLQHMTARVPEVRGLGREVPRALDEILQRLLRKDPRDRYQSAEAVLADVAQIEEALRHGDRDPELVVGLRDRRGTLTESAFVGRSRELAQLDVQIQRTLQGNSSLVVVETESGGGKSRLLDELAQRGRRAGLWVLWGRGSNQVGQHPFQLLDGVVEDVIASIQAEPLQAERIQSALDEQWSTISAVLPQLAEALDCGSSTSLGPEAFGEVRSLQALTSFLDVLGDAHRPALIILDDCQWADESAVKLIENWSAIHRTPGQNAGHVLLVAAYRSEEIAADHGLRNLAPAAHLKLARFDPADTRRLVESMAGPVSDEVVEIVTRLSDGSPFMASAVLRGLVESGSLVAEEGGWRLEAPAAADLQSSRHAASFLTRRLELLPPHAIALLTMGAVLGKEFELQDAIALSARETEEALAAVDLARQRHLIWVRPDGLRCVFVHDKIREALLERLSPNERKTLHHLAAVHLQSLPAWSPFQLAYHFDAAGESRLALHYALEAAEQARARHALEVAEQQYRIAERGSVEADRPTRYRVLEGLGDVLMLRGRYGPAAELFEQAALLAEGRFARAQIKGKLGELALKRGDMEEATRSFEAALRSLGRNVPRQLPVFALLLVWETCVQTLHSLFPKTLVARRTSQPSPADLLSWRLFSRLAHGYWFTRSKIHVLWTHLRGLNLAERHAPTLELAQAYSEHAPAMSLIPYYDRGIAYARKSLEIRRAFGDLWGQGQSLHYYSVVLYAGSRYAECVERGKEAVRLLERTGDFWELHIARYQVAAALYRLGDLPAAIEQARRNYESGIKLGDEQASGISLDVWSRASTGALSQDILAIELKRSRFDAQGAAQVMLAEGVRLIGAGQFEQAADTFERALETARKAGVMNAYVAPNLAWLATARRMQFEKYEGTLALCREEHLALAEVAARRAVKVARWFQNDLPHALREQAILFCLRGQTARGLRRLEQSLAVANRQAARYEYALSRLWRAKIATELKRQDAAAALETARADLRHITDAATSNVQVTQELATLSLADRFDTVLNAGRRIASALSPDAIFIETEAAALQLLRGERCIILQIKVVEGEPVLTPLTGRTGASLDLSLARRTLLTGRALSNLDATEDESNADSHPSGEGSSLAAPVFVRGQAVACLFVVHEHVRHLFGDDEKRLAEFVATLTGAALENAAGFHELEQLNETLEQRVAERTAAAEAASQAKSQFLAMVSHEIRTPMNGIIGMTELTLASPLSAQQKSHLHIVKQSADSLLRLINDILDFSKIEAGRLELEPIELDIREVVGDALLVRARHAAEKGLELVQRIASDVPRKLIGDPGRLRQVIINLVGNAVKFTEQGEILVDVSVEETANDKMRLHFLVRDTGIGIPADKHACIFESFRQADSSTTRRYGGTGLGLAISSQLVELMEGRIWVESEPGHGSTFHFTAELDDCPQAADPLASQLEMLRGLRALVVDDNALQRAALAGTLQGLGMATTTAENSDAAVRACQNSATAGISFDVALIDADLHGQSGWSLHSEIRDIPQLGDCPIVMLSPAIAQDQGDIPELAHVWCLTKPAKWSDLVAALLDATRPRQTEDFLCTENSAPTSAPARPLRVLLVEDGEINREVAVGLLELEGHRVATAENGLEALDILARQSFDVVLMDLEMPELDGMSAAKAIRERETLSGGRTPIIAMTAHAVKGCRERCLSAGMDGFLTKPIWPDELFATLRETVATSAIAL